MVSGSAVWLEASAQYACSERRIFPCLQCKLRDLPNIHKHTVSCIAASRSERAMLCVQLVPVINACSCIDSEVLVSSTTANINTCSCLAIVCSATYAVWRKHDHVQQVGYLESQKSCLAKISIECMKSIRQLCLRFKTKVIPSDQ